VVSTEVGAEGSIKPEHTLHTTIAQAAIEFGDCTPSGCVYGWPGLD